MEDKQKNGFKEKFMVVFDVIFVMLLCFAVLLVTMVITNHLPATEGYAIHPLSIIAVAAILLGYLLFIYKNSVKELKGIFANIFKKS
jgi:uncharacterized integral membrane protein